MARISTYLQLSLDGYFAGPDGELDWCTSNPDPEFEEFSLLMATSPKIVFSTTLDEVQEGPRWQHVEVRHALDVDSLRLEDGAFTTLGSGSIVRQLTTAGAIDEYHLVVNPVLLGAGQQAFTGADASQLDLVESRSFKNGLVWLSYERR